MLVVIDAALVVAPPLLLGQIIDDGVTPKNAGVVVRLSLVVAFIAVLDAVMSLVQRWFSSRIGEGLIFDLRTEVFAHVQRQPIAFFTRAQTGSLVSRLNNDVIGAQQAFTSTLSGVVSQRHRRRRHRRRDVVAVLADHPGRPGRCCRSSSSPPGSWGAGSPALTRESMEPQRRARHAG